MAMKFITGAALGLGLVSMALAQDVPMFGGEEDAAGLAGDDGSAPRGGRGDHIVSYQGTDYREFIL